MIQFQQEVCMYQLRYKSFVLWLAVCLIGLVALVLLVGVALADTGKEMRYTSDREISQDTPTPTATNYFDFVIWGNVRDENGNPVAGVRVEAADKWYYTDAQGWYSFVHLSAGTYVVSPSYGNASFSPPSRTITVPPSVGYMDFQLKFPRKSGGKDKTPTVAPLPRSG